MQYCQQINIRDVDVEDIYIGNGVSELVVMSMQALVNDGDEILVPCPDFPRGGRSQPVRWQACALPV